MIVLLMRHAEREESAPGGPESDLPLTARGLQQVDGVAQQLTKKLVDYPAIERVVSSPHRAAMETARRVLDVVGIDVEPIAHESLDPDVTNPRDPRGIASAIDALPSEFLNAAILIVGHQPLLGELGRSWTGQRVSPVRAGIACIDRETAGARLLWMLEPQNLI